MSFRDMNARPMTHFAERAPERDIEPLEGSLTDVLLPDMSEQPVPRTSTMLSAVSNLTNTVIGAGVLALPFSYRLSGILLGNVFVLVIALSSAFSVHLMVVSEEAARQATGQPHGRSQYQSIMQAALGKFWGLRLTNIFLFVLTFGAMTAFLVILADLFVPVLEKITNATVHRAYVVLGCLIVEIPLSSMKKMDSLSATSTVAMLSISYLVGLIIYKGGINISKARFNDCDHEHGCGSFARFTEELLFTVPIICLAFTCQTSVMPIFNEVQNPSRKTFTRVNLITHTICYLCYALVGTFGYLIFYDSTAQNILRNWDGLDQWDVLLARAGVAITVLFSFPLLAYPNIQIVESTIWPGADWNWPRHIGILCAVLVPAVSIAVATADIGLVFGLTGSLTSSAICFIFPGLMYIQLVSKAREPEGIERPYKSTWTTIGAWIMVVAGFIILFASTGVTIYEAIEGGIQNPLEPTPAPTHVPTLAPSPSF